jgi:DNA-binding transcriptional ArsR family regulator
MDNKIIKLTNAVYKLLEYFPGSDPLKNRIKDKALAITENPKPEDIDILLGYFKIAKLQGWLSAVNCLIISSEYEKIKKDIKPIIELPQSVEKHVKPVGQNPPSHEFTGRQKTILEFLNKNEKAQVMDLQTILSNVTKRTIRRDLDELLAAGKIARFGEFNKVFYRINK